MNNEFEINGHKCALRETEVVLGHKQYQVNVGRGAPTHIRSKLIVGKRYLLSVDGKDYPGKWTKPEARKRAKAIIDAQEAQ
jgi:hypothetical protein